MASILLWSHCQTTGKIHCPPLRKCGDAYDKTTIGQSRATKNIRCLSSLHWRKANTLESHTHHYSNYTSEYLDNATTTKPTNWAGTFKTSEKECTWQETLKQERWQGVQLKEMQTLAPLPQERQSLNWGVFGGHEVKLWMKEDEEGMEKEQEKLWMSRGYFFNLFLPI